MGARARRGAGGRAMIQIGLTGNIGSGKSTVAAVWAGAGVPVVSADDLAREAVRPGSAEHARLVEIFGPGPFRSDGSLDRGVMRRKILDDPSAKRRLEEVLHPKIRALRKARVERERRLGRTAVVSEVPLLFEAGVEDEFDVVVVVHAPERERERRLVERRGLAPGEARRLIAQGGDPEEKLRRAGHVIVNDGGLAALEVASLALLDRLGVRPAREGRDG